VCKWKTKKFKKEIKKKKKKKYTLFVLIRIRAVDVDRRFNLVRFR
jgi:hypothetical protein